MKIRLSLFCLALALIAVTNADAQLAHSFGDQYSQPSAFQNVSGNLFGGTGAGQPGRLWLQSNTADRGLGYEGSYLTVGGKTRLFEDRFDGRWLVEGQAHHSIEDDGGFFSNIGIERVFSVDAAQADVSMSMWYDYDGDMQNDFAHRFHQVGASAQIKTRKWDLIGNGYFPVGIQDYSYGDPSGVNCFVGNRIVMIPGIDSALEGFDVTVRTRPSQLAIMNGTVDFGGYQYSSQLVNSFAGGRVRLGVQAFRGFIVSAEINHDERFDTTGVVSVGWLFGANASGYGSEYSGLGRDLESIVRNDHIVRYNQDVVLAFDPDTGAAYNVVHVNNNADPAFEDGTAERPYSSLIGGQNNSAPADVILVHGGDGTDRRMDRGIVLKDNQRLYGNGQPLLIPVQNNQFFELCADPSGITPTISNDGGFAVVTLANNNEVGGLNIDADNATFGIWGNGTNGNIRDNSIRNANSDGIRLNGIAGNWDFERNTLADNGRDGLFIVDALDTTSKFNFEANVATGNAFEGLHLRNYDPASILFLSNNTSSNTRHGLFLENYLNTNNAELKIQNHRAQNNVGRGVFINGGDGNLRILNSNFTNNGGSGLMVQNWTNTIPTDNIIVGTTTGGTSTIAGNGAFANVEFLLSTTGTRSNVIVTNQSLNNGIRGLAARATGVGTTMNIDILDNLSINNNVNEGVRLLALDGATINSRIGNTDVADPLEILDNAIGGGSGIQLIAQGLNGQPAARINSVIDNVTINNRNSDVIIPGSPTVIVPTQGIEVDSLENGVVDVSVHNVTIGAPGSLNNRDTHNGVLLNFDNTGSELINRVVLDDLTLFSNFGVVLFTGTETYSDLVLTNSTILPMGAQSVAGVRSDNTPFLTDGVGLNGVFVVANGQGTLTGQFNMNYPTSDLDLSFVEIVSDGVLDNLTRVHLEDNIIQDFTLDGVDVSTFGDAQMLLTMRGNQILNNGAGFNDDNDNDNVYGEQGADGGGIADPNNLFFFDGVNIDAFDQSSISARITNNFFQDNFERGLSLNTFNSATINALVEDNSFVGNDRGEDVDNLLPEVGTGVASNGTPAIGDSATFDFEAVNNEEFYFRPYESLVLTRQTDGTLIDLAGANLGNDLLGFFFPGNGGVDIFGNPVAFGTATMNLGMSGNALQLGPDIQDFAALPGDFRLGLDGLTNGFTGPFFGVSTVPFPFAESAIVGEEGFFGGEGFVFPPH